MDQKTLDKRRLPRKRRNLKMPNHIPLPVKGLWLMASQEQKQQAHKTAALVLETWLGIKSRKTASQDLGIPPVRFWQLSQQASAGMVAGLLVQPKRRLKGDLKMALNPDDDPKKLKKKIQLLERHVQILKDLVAVLRELPGNQIAQQAQMRAHRRMKDAEKPRRKKHPTPKPTENPRGSLPQPKPQEPQA